MDGSVLQLSFIWQAKESTFLRCEGRQTRKEKRSQRLNFGSSFYMFFLYVLCEHMFYMFFLYVLPLSLSCVKLGQPRGCLLHLRCSLRSLDLPLSHFHRLFPSLSFNHHHYRLLQSPYSSVHLRLSDIFRGQLQLHISLLNWHGTLQIVDLGRDKMGQTIDNTWFNHKQHQ